MTAALVESEMKIYDLPMDDIFLDEGFNCRGRIAPIDVIDLVKSIESHGLQQPIVVEPYNKNNKKWRIIAGHRRYTAFKIMDRVNIPCVIREGLDEVHARAFNLIENIKRQDLNVLQEAKALEHFKKAGMIVDDIAAILGTSRGWTQIRFMVLDLPSEVQKEVAAGFLSQAQIRQVHSIPTKEKQFEAVRTIKERKLSGEKTPVRVVKRKIHPMAKKPRTREEVFELQDVIQKVLGNSLITRVLGWAAGEVNDYEIYRELKDIATEKGVKYEIPSEIIKRAF